MRKRRTIGTVGKMRFTRAGLDFVRNDKGFREKIRDACTGKIKGLNSDHAYTLLAIVSCCDADGSVEIRGSDDGASEINRFITENIETLEEMLKSILEEKSF